MLLSVETYVLRERFGDEAALRLIKNAGFDAYDYSFYWTNEKSDMLGDDYLEHATKIRAISNSLGLVCNQAHAPFDIRYGDVLDETGEKYRRLVRAIHAASVLGAPNIIVHVLKPSYLPEDVDFWEFNQAYIKSLAPYCEKHNINVSVETLFNGDNAPVLGKPEDMQRFLKELESERFNTCIDLGHLSKSGLVPEEVIRASSKETLKTLHVQDNNLKDDSHWLPYCGDLNWDGITSALAEMGYSGDFTFEICGYLKRQDEANIPAALKFAEQTGRLLIDKISKAKRA